MAAAEDRTGVDSAAVFRPNEIHGVKIRRCQRQPPARRGRSRRRRRDHLRRPRPRQRLRCRRADHGQRWPTVRTLSPICRREPTSFARSSVRATSKPIRPRSAEHSGPAASAIPPWEMSARSASPRRWPRARLTARRSASRCPTPGALTNLVDVFLLFDDTGSFVNNSPIVRAAFPGHHRRSCKPRCPGSTWGLASAASRNTATSPPNTRPGVRSF